MTTAYEKAIEALGRGETIRLQRWQREERDQHGRPVPILRHMSLFEARFFEPGEETPMAALELTASEADQLAGKEHVVDERSPIVID